MTSLKAISKIFLITILISQTALGIEAKYLPQGTPTPYEGYLLTPSKTKEIRQQLIDAETLKLINTSLTTTLQRQKDITALTEDKVKIVSEQNDKLAKALISERSVNNWERLLWFSLGVVGAGFAVWAVKKVAQ